jgi:hypothetical protein
MVPVLIAFLGLLAFFVVLGCASWRAYGVIAGGGNLLWMVVVAGWTYAMNQGWYDDDAGDSMAIALLAMAGMWTLAAALLAAPLAFGVRRCCRAVPPR